MCSGQSGHLRVRQRLSSHALPISAVRFFFVMGLNHADMFLVETAK